MQSQIFSFNTATTDHFTDHCQLALVYICTRLAAAVFCPCLLLFDAAWLHGGCWPCHALLDTSYGDACLVDEKQSTQDLLQRMCADLFQDRPSDAVGYLMQWLEAERQRREEKQDQAVAAAGES